MRFVKLNLLSDINVIYATYEHQHKGPFANFNVGFSIRAYVLSFKTAVLRDKENRQIMTSISIGYTIFPFYTFTFLSKYTHIVKIWLKKPHCVVSSVFVCIW